jgi:hypothetical protein
MTSTPSEAKSPRRPLGLSSAVWALVACITLGMVAGGFAIYLLLGDRDDARESSTDARKDADAVAGQAAELVECVNDPATTQSDCEDKAAAVETIIKAAKDGAPGVAGPPGSDGQDGLDGADGSNGQDGRTVRGPRGFIGPVGPNGAPGSDGQDGSDGASVVGPPGPAGPPGATGETGSKGDTGAAGSDGKDGADGEPGRGVRSVDCDPDTQQFVVTFSDDTTQVVDGSDCVASLLDPVGAP